MTGEFVLIGGGARSGKSDFALEVAERLAPERLFLATAQALDAEMEERIDRHRRERSGRFSTLEEPRRVVAALAGVPDHGVVVIDCITIWLSNLMLDGLSDSALEREIDALANALGDAPFHCVAVTNEVGCGVVPESALGRRFRDCAGRANQRLAAQASRVYLASLGCILQIKPTLEVVPRDSNQEGSHV
jgi:adenosylcobinamide kinase/adenosylcobinamide-phosphate guanylyltransferase